ncbi:hypothetical protein C8Q70DRAFT_83714 [Cubamyces menziesii]|nr:hypothetical protein C8Q70DRAFT_83714 [Cubamyces menziesii]
MPYGARACGGWACAGGMLHCQSSNLAIWRRGIWVRRVAGRPGPLRDAQDWVLGFCPSGRGGGACDLRSCADGSVAWWFGTRWLVRALQWREEWRRAIRFCGCLEVVWTWACRLWAMGGRVVDCELVVLWSCGPVDWGDLWCHLRLRVSPPRSSVRRSPSSLCIWHELALALRSCVYPISSRIRVAGIPQPSPIPHRSSFIARLSTFVVLVLELRKQEAMRGDGRW